MLCEDGGEETFNVADNVRLKGLLRKHFIESIGTSKGVSGVVELNCIESSKRHKNVTMKHSKIDKFACISERTRKQTALHGVASFPQVKETKNPKKK